MVASEDRLYEVVGTRPVRPDGTDKVTGRAQYGADFHLSGVLHGAVKRSPHAHTRIRRIDVSKALAHPGVKAVISREDFPLVSGGLTEVMEGPGTPLPQLVDRIMASEKALFRGHAVAAVCATDLHAAEDACDLIEVDYEVLASVTDVRESMSEGAPILHEDMRTQDFAGLGGPKSDRPTNIASQRRFAKGDLEEGFRQADVVVEGEYETSRYHQGYIEPHNATAFWNKDGYLTVWASTQGIFGVRASLADILGLPLSHINVMPVEIGGGFGGKLVVYLEPLAALLAKKTGRPVKLTMRRDEVFEATGPTSGSFSRFKIGAKKDGTIVAAEATMAFESGAYAGSPIGGGMNSVFAPYDIPNVLVDGYDVLVNLSKTAPYRAPGGPAAMFGSEVLINDLAEKLEMDPIDLRLKNAADEGTVRANGQRFQTIGNIQLMQAMRETAHYRSELQGPNQGRGIALGYSGNVGGESSSSASVNTDGSVSLVLGSVDIGGTRAAIAMQLAEALGIAVEDVHPKIVDTDSVGFTGSTGGSRTAFAGGWAAYELGMQIREALEERAARIWECEPRQVRYGDDGTIRGPVDSEGRTREIGFKQLAAQLQGTGGIIDTSVNANHGTYGPAFGGHIVDLEVDPETGKVDVLRYTAVQDSGTSIHPSYVEGQVQGGVAQGLGMALTEEYSLSNGGEIVNPSFLDYRIPTALDLPMIETVLVDVPNPGHPYGVRGAGEVPIVPPLAAAQTAIFHAIGERFASLPITPRKIVERLLDE